MTKHVKIKNVTLKTAGLSVLALLIVYVAAVAVIFYGFGPNNSIVGRTADMLRFPVAVVDNKRVVTVKELNADLASIKRFYESQDFSEVGLRVDFSTEDGQKRLKIKERKLLNKLIENRAIEGLAAEKNIKITDKMALQNVQRELEQYNNDAAVREKIFSLYGWDMDDFIEKIVKPDMYREELEKNRPSMDTNYAGAKDRIGQAQKELKDGIEFAEVAKKYSEGDSAENGGELGWFSADQVMLEIAIVAFLMEKGEYSDIIETPLGFHIVQIDDKKMEDGIEKIKVRQIIVKTKSFPDWLLEKEIKMHVAVFLKDYYWNKETATVEFRDQGLRDFENNLDKNSVGDASVIF